MIRLPARQCPACGKKLDAVSTLEGKEHETPLPNPGDVSVCMGCCSVNQFQADMSLAKADISKFNLAELKLIAEVVFAIKVTEPFYKAWKASQN